MNAILEKNKGYLDVTKYYLNNKKIDNYSIIDAKYFKDYKGNKYYIDGKNVILDYSKKEKKWLYG